MEKLTFKEKINLKLWSFREWRRDMCDRIVINILRVLYYNVLFEHTCKHRRRYTEEWSNGSKVRKFCKRCSENFD